VVVGHQVTVPPGTVSSVPSSMGEEVTSKAREYACISAGTFHVLLVLYLESQQCPRYVILFYHSDGVLLHKMGVRVLLVYFGTWIFGHLQIFSTGW